MDRLPCPTCAPLDDLIEPIGNLIMALDQILPHMPEQHNDPEDMIRTDALVDILSRDTGERHFDIQLMAFLVAVSKLSSPIHRNLCMVCQEDMGPENPRQLCAKTFCANGSLAPRKRSRPSVDLDLDLDDAENTETDDEAAPPIRNVKRRLFTASDSEGETSADVE